MDDLLLKGVRGFLTIALGTFLFSTFLRSQNFVPNELIVKFRSDAPDSVLNQIFLKKDLSAVASQNYTQSIRKISTIAAAKKSLPLSVGAQSSTSTLLNPTHIARVMFADGQTTDKALGDLQGSPFVEYAQRNYIYKIDQLPNDSAVSSQWNLDQIGIFDLWAGGFFDQPLPQVIVGVLDTGVDYLHPDISARIYVNPGETGLDEYGRDKRTNGVDDDGNGYIDDWHGYDFVDQQVPDIGDWSTRDNDPMDENGHGTAVAGIIGAQVNNKIGIAGISPVAQIVPLRAFNADGNGTDADIAAAIMYAADNGVQVLNMSFGDVIMSPLMKDVIQYAHSKNVVLVASSGNDGTSYPHYPSDFSEVISVGSVSQADARSFFSSYGPSLALVAPGESIPTLTLGGGYQSGFTGTSAAAPHVSAVASLLISLDQLKRGSSPSYLPLTNDEVRADLLGACIDLGDKGWDNYYGAGLVNARVLLSLPQRNVVQITSPQVDAQLSSPIVPIIGSATTDELDSVYVFFGAGDSPTAWNEIAAYGARNFINDTLAIWNISSLPEGTYTLRLQVKNIQVGDVESRIRVLITRSGPTVLGFTFQDSTIIQEEYGALVSLRVDKPCSAKLWYRTSTPPGEYKEMLSSEIGLDHSFLMTQSDFVSGASYDFYVEATDQAGNSARYPTVATNGTDHFTFTFTGQNISTTGFTELPFTLPSGFILNRTAVIAGKATVVLNQYDTSGNFGKLMAFQYANGAFIPVDSNSRQWVPRDLKDAFNDGRLSTLVQDEGATELFTSNTGGSSFFANQTFVDSADVWGSQLYDFDGDGKLDLIARSSTQYLVFKNMGENKFQLMAQLDDPTPPLPGDATNQFGPPKSLVGDFSGTGNAEIIFADYDGDMIMYRQVNKQTAPFQFQLVWTDTTDLLETSDYLAAGDFNGDGQLDFAIAGHSNLDLNADREYDPPTWTVRIFTHRPADPVNAFSVIWEQTFYGVKTGVLYDNGISSGKILGTSTDQLFLSLNPYLYVISYDPASQKFVPVWVHSSVSNSVLVSDFNGNGIPEIGFNADGKTRFFEHASTASKPQAPWGVSATPLSARAVEVQWNSVAPSATHKVYRDTISQPQNLLASVTGTSFIDTTVLTGKTYWYAVSLMNQTESDHSASVSTMAHNPARIDSAGQQTLTQISLWMSVPVDQNRLAVAVIVVDDTLNPTTIAIHSPSNLLLTFSEPFARDSHYVRIKNLFDVYGMEADTIQRTPFFAPLQQTHTFYLESASFVTQSLIAIVFNDALSASALDVTNYHFSNAVRTFALKDVKLDTVSRTKVFLSLADNEHLTPIGFKMDLTASDQIQNIQGEALNDGKGQSVSLVIDINNLDNIMVFPDPLRYSYADANRNHLTFANVPEYCRIDIFEPSGVKVATLEGNTPADGISWNLNDQHGRPVGSGIYIFMATQLDANNNKIRTKLGKFAVIR
ncbi:MAG: S8 family serine peptidase [Bacteroidota bacterium]